MSTIRDPATITKVGRQMMTAGGDITYTKATLYGQDISHLTKDQLESLTSIGNPLVTVPLGISDKNDNGNGTTVILEATFQNSNLKADLPYTAVGFFAKRGDDAEKLIAVGVATEGAYLAATSPDGVATDALDLKLAIAIGDATSVTATVDPAGSVTPATLNGAISETKQVLTALIDTKASQSNLDQTNAEVAKKADSEAVNSQLATKANTTDIDKQVKTLNDAINTKADKATVDAEISKIDFTPYAKTADVNKEIKTVTDLANTKVDATYSYSKAELDKKLLALSTDTSGKVNASQVASMIAGKADKTDVDQKIATVNKSVSDLSDTVSANKTATDASLATKANASDVADNVKTLQANIATKADKATVDAEIAKIDFTPYAKTVDVDTKIKDVSDVVATKVGTDYSYSKAELDKKLLALSTDTSGKVDANQVATMIEGKADKTDLDNEIKAVTDLANTKANTVDVDSKIKTVTDLANTKANSADVYTKNETDNQINKFDLSKVKFRKQFLNGDGDKVDKTWSATKNDDGTYTIDLYNDDWTASKLSDVIYQLPSKADKSNTYTKTDVDNKVNEAKSNAQSTANQIWGEINNLKGKQKIVQMRMPYQKQAYITVLVLLKTSLLVSGAL